IHYQDSRYKVEAYVFVMEALSYTQKKFKSIKHVSADELLEGMKELLINKFGPLAMTVLHHWGIRSTEDFGNIVFHLIDNKVLCKTDQDNIDTFRNRYDFNEVFLEGYRKQLHKKVSRMRTG
ncbi:MAG: hypothetical protein KC733_10890, partial [Candidatus Omnitrophica bacterium]|nr:hypothetical protein [Candidatus Omnitrophota bacterium]